MQLLIGRAEALGYRQRSRQFLVLLITLSLAGIGSAGTDTKPELVLQTGHTDTVECIVFSPDGRWLVSSGEDHMVRLWDLGTGLELRRFRGHTAGIAALAFAPNAQFLASAGADRSVKVWDVATGQEIRTFPLDKAAADYPRVAFSSDGNHLEVVSQGVIDHSVIAKVWNTQNWEPVTTLGSLHNALSSLMSFSPDGHSLAIPTDTTVEVHELPSGASLEPFVIQHDSVYQAVFSPDGKQLVTRDSEALRAWDVSTRRRLYSYPIRIYSLPVSSPAFSADGKLLGVTSGENGVTILNASTGQETNSIQTEFVKDLAISPDNRYLAGAKGSVIAILDLKNGREYRRLGGNLGTSVGATLSDDGRWYAASSEDDTVRLWDLTAARGPRLTVPATASSTTTPSPAPGDQPPTLAGVAVSPDGHSLALLDSAGTIRLFDPAGGQQVRTLPALGSIAWGLAFSPDGRKLVTGIWQDNTRADASSPPPHMSSVKLVDLSVEGEVKSLPFDSHNEPTNFVFSSDGHWLAAETLDSVYIWDVTKGTLLRAIRVDFPRALAFTPDGSQIAVAHGGAGTPNPIDLFDVNTGKLLRSISGHRRLIYDLRFSSDGAWLISGSEDQTVKLWDMSKGEELQTFSENTTGVNAVAISTDRRWLLAAGFDGTIRIWSTSRHELVALLAGRRNTDDWVVAAPDGLFDGSPDGVQKLVAWRLGNSLYAADRFYATNYTPDLLSRLLAGEKPKAEVVLDALKLPPAVRIMKPSGESKLTVGRVTVVVEAKDQGGGIAEVHLFQNGKLVGQRPGKGNGDYPFDVDLVAGINDLRATAVSQDKVEANDDHVQVMGEAVAAAPTLAKPALRLLVAGVSEYEDPAFDLNFARPDAESIVGFFQEDKLFSSVAAIKLYDRDASKTAIQEGLAKLAEQSQRDDVILIYLAGHGVGLGEQFYFLPHDMRRESDDEAAIRKYGIPASAVADALMRAKALKQVLILDTCESESALPLLAKVMMFRSRGASAAEEKAVKMLARSYGVYLIAASTKDQEAYEVKALGHGVLTYALLTGLGEKGPPKAPTASEGIVTIESLVQYVHDQVPELTEKYHHQKQYAVTSTTGTDFPLWAH